MGVRLSRPGLGRWVVAISVLAASLSYAVLASFAFGTYYLTDAGVARLREQAAGLVLAVGVGVGGLVAFRALTAKPVVSAWLLVGFSPAVVGALNHLGIIR